MWNKIKDSKGFYIAISIIFAIACWVYVDITVEPDIQITVRNIPVSFEGLDALRSRGLMISNSKEFTISLKLSGQRSVLSQLNKNNVNVTVEASSQITVPGEQNLDYTVTFPNTISNGAVKIRSKSVETIDVNVIRISSKTVAVYGSFTGSVAEGCMEDGFQLEYDNITVSGDKSLIKRIDHAVVTLEKSGLSKTWEGTLPVTLLDQNGETIDSEQLSLSSNEMDVTLVVRKIKEIPLTVTIKDGGGATEADATWEITPKHIVVSGPDEELAELTEWNIGTVDLSQVITSANFVMDISLPQNLTCQSGEKTAKVSVTLPKLSTVKQKTDNIKMTHYPANKTVSLETKTLEVRCRGTKKALELLEGNDIEVTVDLSQLKADAFGTCQVPAEVTIPGFSELGAVGTYEVSVFVS